MYPRLSLSSVPKVCFSTSLRIKYFGNFKTIEQIFKRCVWNWYTEEHVHEILICIKVSSVFEYRGAVWVAQQPSNPSLPEWLSLFHFNGICTYTVVMMPKLFWMFLSKGYTQLLMWESLTIFTAMICFHGSLPSQTWKYQQNGSQWHFYSML